MNERLFVCIWGPDSFEVSIALSLEKTNAFGFLHGLFLLCLLATLVDLRLGKKKDLKLWM